MYRVPIPIPPLDRVDPSTAAYSNYYPHTSSLSVTVMLQDSLLDSFAVRPASNRRATPECRAMMPGHSNADILAASTVVVGLSHAVVALGVLFANYSPPARAAA